MTGKQKKYNFIETGSVIFMILALLWLTVSAPFVFVSQQELAKQNKMADTQSPLSGSEEEASNPFSTSTEEKNPGSTSLSEEYLHDHDIVDYFFSINLQPHKCENSGTYISYHGELLVPPPNAA